MHVIGIDVEFLFYLGKPLAMRLLLRHPGHTHIQITHNTVNISLYVNQTNQFVNQSVSSVGVLMYTVDTGTTCE